MNDLKMLIIAHDFPYPPNCGGRIDMLNRLRALHSRNVKIFLVTWLDREPTEIEYSEVKKYVYNIKVFRRTKLPLRLLISKYPSYVIDRMIDKKDENGLIASVNKFEPDVIFLDGIAGSLCAINMLKHLNKIALFIYRSHNIEHKYAEGLYKAETQKVRKFARYLNINKVYDLEKKIREKSDMIFEISAEDKIFWGTSEKVFVQNPIIESKYVSLREQDIDILFVGGLCRANNIYGLKWFIDNAAKFLKKYRIVFAGANPSEAFIQYCKINQVEIFADPKDIKAVLARGKVLINPIFHGSGINIKILEMLSTGKPIVSTTKGVRALNSEMIKFIRVTDDPTIFARSIEEALINKFRQAQIDMFLNLYSDRNIDLMLNHIQEKIIRDK